MDKPSYTVSVRLTHDEFMFLKKLGISKSQLFHDTIANVMDAFRVFKEEAGYPSSLLARYKPKERKPNVKGLPLILWVNPPDDLLKDSQRVMKKIDGKDKKKDIEGFPYHG